MIARDPSACRRWLAALVFLAAGCERYETLVVLPEGALRTQYLLDFEHTVDPETLVARHGFLLIFNPGAHTVPVDVTVYYEDRDPDHFALEARPGTTTGSAIVEWPVVPQGRFALGLDSAEPVIAQATIAWDNTGGNLSAGALTKSPTGVREAATSYMAIPRLADRWYFADGLVIDNPTTLWVRETESTIVLNPGNEDATVRLSTFYRPVTRHQSVQVPARRVMHVRMDDLAFANHHYGLRVTSDRPVAVQSRRVVYWNGSPDVMTFWSTPCVALPSAAAAPGARAAASSAVPSPGATRP